MGLQYKSQHYCPPQLRKIVRNAESTRVPLTVYFDGIDNYAGHWSVVNIGL